MMTRNGLIAVVLLFSLRPASAINEEWGTKVLVQPDGTSFVVREFVDEFGHYLLSEGGLVVQEPISQYYYYARYDSEGNAAPSSFRVVRDDALAGVAELARENGNTLREIASQSQGRVEVFLGGAFSGGAKAASGPSTLELIVILAEFSDVKHQNPDPEYWPITDRSLLGSKDCYFSAAGCGDKKYSEYTVDHFETMLFGGSYTSSPDGEKAHGSMRQYWLDMSKDVFRLGGEVANNRDADGIPEWVELSKEKSDFHSGSQYDFRKAVLDAAQSQQSINVSTSATRKICIIYAGNMYVTVDAPTLAKPKNKDNGLNPHYASDVYIMSEKYAPSHPTPRNRESNSANFSHIGVHCHEFGHVLGLGDKYEKDDLRVGRGYRQWGVMADGGNKAVKIRGDNPAPLSPHHRAALGWIVPKEVKELMTGVELSYSAARSSYQDDVYKIASSTDPDDFFLIENRQTGEGWNQALALDDGGGLLIWHIGEKRGLRNDYIDLVEADGSALHSRTSYYGDLFPGSTGKTALTDFTTPNSRKWGPDDPLTDASDPANPANPGDNSDVLVFNIHRGSGTTMRADLSPFWVGEISADMTWSRTVTVGGDVTVMPRATLTIEKGTKVQFLANRDDDGDGHLDNTRSEFIVKGRLIASGGDITFGSANLIDPSRTDWYGIRVENGGLADLSDATVRDGSRCAEALGTGTLTIENTVFLNCGLAPPSPPMKLRVVLGDGQVTLHWEAADANGSPITAYHVRYRLSSGSDSDWTKPTSLSASELSYTVKELNNDEKYLFEVWAENGQGKGTAARETATPQVVIDGLPDPEFAEIPEGEEAWDSLVATYEKSGSFTWELDGPDKDWLELTGDGTESRELHFKEGSPPDFENPQDSGLDGTNTYHVTVRVRPTDAVGSEGEGHEKAVVVKVTNVDEDGTVTLLSPSEPPKVGEEITAEPKDPDGVREVTNWKWQRKEKVEYSGGRYYFTTIQEGGDSSYEPEETDIGSELRVVVTYNDGHGTNKKATSEETSAVVGPELDGPAAATFVENDTKAVAQYEVFGVDGPVKWSLFGEDAARFKPPEDSARSRQWQLHFLKPPNYEMPTDTDEGGTNTYHITVVAIPTDGAPSSEQDSQDSQDPFANLFAAFKSLSNEDVSAHASSSLTQAVVVTVEDGDDPGVVSLPAGPPRVGTLLTAWLVDEDEDLTDMVWTWLADGDVVHTASGDTTAGYEPQPADESRALQAQVGYKDPFGAKTVVSALTAAVQPIGAVSLTPDPPRLCQPGTAELSGPAQISGETWTWERRQQGSDEWHFLRSASASDVAPSASAEMYHSFHSNSGKRSRYEPTVQDTNWVLRATVSWDEHEVSSPDSAPVRAGVPNRPRSLAGEGANGDDGYGAVVLSWQTPNNCGSEITGYEYRHRRFGTTHWKPNWTEINGSGATTTTHRVDGLDHGAQYTLEVRAISDTHRGRLEGQSARTTATAKRFNSAPVITCDPPFPRPILENTKGPLTNTEGPVSTCRADDAEGDKVSWQLTGPDASFFWFPNRRLRLWQPQDFEDPLDHDGDHAYQLRLIARDARDPTLSDTLDATVWLLNEDEPPELYGQSQRSILENRTGFVASYYADDPEDEDLTWSLSGPDHHLFGLTPTGAKHTESAPAPSGCAGHGDAQGGRGGDGREVVVVSEAGASSGIGRALALVLAERGARLVLVARRVGTWSPMSPITTTEATLTGLTNNASYPFEVAVVNRLGYSLTPGVL